jgi:cation diffusion facilitator CzcD-associated flavoprotein CzcO
MGDPGQTEANGGKPQIKTDLWQYGRRRRNEGPYEDNLDIDVLIVGAGFGGAYCLYEMRKAGYKTVLYEAGTSFGGTWRWNMYPGARVDSPVPIYELSIPEVYNTWHWSTNYPDWRELQSYFDHVDKVLNLSQDCAFESVVVSAEFDIGVGKWVVKTQDGRTAKARFLIVAAGFAAKRHIPGIKGLDTFKGTISHSSFWPAEGIEYKGKRVAIIGTGASGVQMISEMGQDAKQLTVFQRTPNLALPMGRRLLTEEEQDRLKPFYKEILAYRERCFAGFHYDLCERNTFDDTPEEREAFFEQLWKQAGFALWLGGYKDYLFDWKSNRESYNFWRKKQSVRVRDPEKKKILFPEEPPHPFGVKRPCLEQNYYEILDQDNVEVVNINEKTGGTPITEFTEKGIKTSDGKEREFDVIGLATGFDVVTGGMTNMGLKSIHGTYLKDEWKDGAHTYLGTTISGYPNMFHLYGPHGPTLLSNGPTSVEIQARWIRDAIKLASRQGLKYINPTKEASDNWKKRIQDLAAPSLFPTTRSTYMGGTVPGKAFEMTCYAGGVNMYGPEIRQALTGWQGFTVVAA